MSCLKKIQEREEDAYTSISYSIREDGAEIGGCSVMVDAGYAYCERIDIYEGYRSQGHGTAALRALSDMYGGIVVAPDNSDAQHLYERIGSEWSGDSAPYLDQGYGVYII